tara:strand:- start:763 stop:1650 length:888 start_codon:yes stop_codon:yes gene_type:complete
MDKFDLTKFLAEGKLHEADNNIKAIAQAVADAFSAEDDLDLKYVITPGSIERGDGSSFDLDTEAGPNTPSEDWEDKEGFSIENYLGTSAGGSFYIKDGKVFNAAMRNAEIANVSDLLGIEQSGEETDYMQRRREMDDYAMDENKETKPNKMKKSELKEMIKAAMMAETSVDEAEKVDVTDDENIDVDIEKDVKIDDEESEVDIDVKASMPGENEDVEEVQALLMKAQQAAADLGDEKLTDQIGNTITYFTRSHVSRVAEADVDGPDTVTTNIDDVAAAEIGLDESVAFPMWNKIK